MSTSLIRFLRLAMLVVVVLAMTNCQSGGGDDGPPTPPAAPVVSVDYDVKSVILSWPAVSAATSYRISRNPGGGSGYSQIGGDQTATTYTDTLALHLTDWINLSYIVSACNAGGCTDSSASTSLDLLQAIGYFKASNTGPFGDGFGANVALSADGTTLAVAALFEDSDANGVNDDESDVSDGFDAGAVYVFTRTGGVWAQQAYVKASNSALGDSFGWSLALSDDGDTLAVGAIGEDGAAKGVDGDDSDDSASNAGAVYVFTRTAGAWSQHAYVKASNTDAGDQFGNIVALSGDGATLAVGAWQEASDSTEINGDEANNNAPGAGAVYVFTRTAGAWSQEAYVKSSLAGDGGFGQSVAIAGDGNTLAVGSENGPGANGAVSVLTRSNAAWTRQDRLVASNNAINVVGFGRSHLFYSGFGSPLALSADGNTLAVGAYSERSAAKGINGDETDTSADSAGAVYVFTRSGAAWSQQAYVKASNTDAGDLFGSSVALSASGDALAVGASGEGSLATGVNGDETDNTNGSGTGAAYVYTRTGTTWAQQAYVKPSNTHPNPHQLSHFGTSIALSSEGDTLAIGAFTEDSAATGVNGDQTDVSASGAGAVYLY